MLANLCLCRLCVFIANFLGKLHFQSPIGCLFVCFFVLLRTGWSISIEAKSSFSFFRLYKTSG